MEEKRASAAELLEYVEETLEHFKKTGVVPREGTMRALSKLTARIPGAVLRRTYIHLPGEGYAMWDVVSEDELVNRGFEDTGYHSYGVSGVPRVVRDTVGYWKSQKEGGRELWVGEPLAD